MGNKYRHLKTGNIYEILSFSLLEADPNVRLVTYQGAVDNWTRPYKEFFDGRFQLIIEDPPEVKQQVELVPSNNYVQPVPNHCDRIMWRGVYYALPIYTNSPSVECNQLHEHHTNQEPTARLTIGRSGRVTFTLEAADAALKLPCGTYDLYLKKENT
jgi:hypothetical protein